MSPSTPPLLTPANVLVLNSAILKWNLFSITLLMTDLRELFFTSTLMGGGGGGARWEKRSLFPPPHPRRIAFDYFFITHLGPPRKRGRGRAKVNKKINRFFSHSTKTCKVSSISLLHSTNKIIMFIF